MAINKFFNTTRINAFIVEKKLPPTCAIDMELALLDALDEDDEVKNVAALEDWLQQRPHLVAPENRRSPVNIALERAAFGQGNATARSTLFREYGEYQYAERMADWGASPRTLRPGREPGTSTEEVVEKAEKIVRSDNENANNPFNPKKKYSSDQARQNEIGKFITFFGTKSAAAAAKKFGTDLAGRPLRPS
ncbi:MULTISPECIES: hypothetical protein [Bradyrhizobium]|uniref:Uncharacterized protein n=2 Tax=Bradyrhizobium TaxID=374 RepID=A0ABY0PK55_9BRAD|nr:MULTISPECIES: hypothetical protein [Bradyrhizobium]SDI55202.1 hypothetical protein SAMN05444163_3104 [Bradyrhizobium ottawaense]SED42251.1 hypothetical protein SAMN05444171_4065 [Bradyrhizobium lablabi]